MGSMQCNLLGGAQQRRSCAAHGVPRETPVGPLQPLPDAGQAAARRGLSNRKQRT